MQKRFLSIWLRYLKTDWFAKRHPELKTGPLAVSKPDHGRMVVVAVNSSAAQQGVYQGMVVADARAVCPGIEVVDDILNLENKLLRSIALWCIRFTPVAAVDPPDGIVLDISGCAHLWGGEKQYAEDIMRRLQDLGYYSRIGIADTIGLAWAAARYGRHFIIASGEERNALSLLPPPALRIGPDVAERLHKLGLQHTGQLLSLPKHTLRRRFGEILLLRLDQALGTVEEMILPVIPVAAYQERLPCLEPIATATGIHIALEQLLDQLCKRLTEEGKGARQLRFTCHRIDNRVQHLIIGTHRASQHAKHLFRLFEERIATIEPGLGIEVFTLDALKVEDVSPVQEKLWQHNVGIAGTPIGELMDRITNKLGEHCVHRYLPDEHYWPERSVKLASTLTERTKVRWKSHLPRPLQLLPAPQPVQVAAPVPDYPPMLFRYRGQVHRIKKADGPERIEQEWWIENGAHRDYYVVEDEAGCRYWLFRLGHYDPEKNNQWFLHGYFA